MAHVTYTILVYRALYPTRLESAAKPLWQPVISQENQHFSYKICLWLRVACYSQNKQPLFP